MASVRSITLLGHKDHGKSTLIGNLLMLTKSVTQMRVKEAEKYSKKLHKNFEPAFILDSFHEEREGGLTIDITRAEIQYKDVAFSFIDVPGHEELIKNMISGASYASTALLLVSAKRDEGIRDQTKRHLFIAKMLGIDNLVVAVNKMDSVGYGKARFDEVAEGIAPFIKRIGFPESNVRFIPVSAYKGDNLVKRSPNMKWYKGKTLLELIYEDSEWGPRNGDNILRILVQGRLGDGKKEVITGKIISGRIKVGERVCITPIDTYANVNGITVGGKSRGSAKVGENVALRMNKRIVGEVRGGLVCGGDYCPVPRDRLSAQIFVVRRMDKDTSIRFNGIEIPCIIKPLEYIDPTTGDVTEKGRIAPLGAARAEVRLSKKIPAESFSTTRELGRFVIYSRNEFVGMGIVS